MDEQDQPDLLPYMVTSDYRKIVDKIIAGKAHELSESDTLYLGACTKGATAEKSLRPQYYGDHVPLPEIGGLVAVGLIAKVIFLQKIAQLPLGSGILGQRLRIRDQFITYWGI